MTKKYKIQFTDGDAIQYTDTKNNIGVVKHIEPKIHLAQYFASVSSQ